MLCQMPPCERNQLVDSLENEFFLFLLRVNWEAQYYSHAYRLNQKLSSQSKLTSQISNVNRWSLEVHFTVPIYWRHCQRSRNVMLHIPSSVQCICCQVYRRKQAQQRCQKQCEIPSVLTGRPETKYLYVVVQYLQPWSDPSVTFCLQFLIFVSNGLFSIVACVWI